MQKTLISIALFGAFTLSIAAYADPANSDEIVVTATRLPQALRDTLADTSIINAQQIRNAGAPDVATLLRSLAGVEIVQSGGLGSQSSTHMRGNSSSQVLVLLDGVRINSATAGSTAIEHIMLENIERIEVVRGNVSSLYGSEAIGGVIQLFSKRGHGEPALNASAGIGNHGTQRMSAGFSGEIDRTAFSLNAAHDKTDGVSAMNPQLAPNANPNNNGYDNNTFNAQVKHAFNNDHALTLSAFNTRGNISFDNAFGALTDLNNSLQNLSKFALAEDDQINALWHSQVRVAQGTDDLHSYTNGALSSRFQTKNKQFAWQNNLNITDRQQLHLTAEYLGQNVASDTLFSQTARHVTSVLGGYTGHYGAQQVQLNLRQDNYSDFGAANTGLLAYGIAFADAWRATASLSNAFKAPTFNDMYYPLSFGYQGNPKLQPERSQNQEIGLHYAANNQRVDAIYFDNRSHNLIAINSTFTTMININQAQISGEELSYAGDFGTSHLQAHLTLQNPRDTLTGKTLVRRAKEFASVAASHDFAEFNMGAEIRQSGVRQDSDPVTGAATTLPAYALLNLTTRYALDTHISVNARLDNIFNRNYAEVYGYNTPGRWLFVGLTYQQ